ncbi:hypothetical protein Cgig2_027917 [Carnegiea gigantea]|uniref:Uncharacterized protein n=1 Tax=Carnegiea gigantea TaxID=171969 RepID=A0A9Q1KN78_9CARY|nr:hypothetical protein Cgig2_027917 [Carnegiea gigantea]
MVFSGGVHCRGQRWAAGKGSTFAGRPPSDLRFSCFCPWCLFSCFAWHVAQSVASHHPRHFPPAGGRHWHRQDGWPGQCRGRPEVAGVGHDMFQAQHSTSEESRVGSCLGKIPKEDIIKAKQVKGGASKEDGLKIDFETEVPNEAPKALENNQQLASPYKQALLSYPNSNKLEAPNGNLEVVGNDVHEGLSDNSKTITQPLDGAHNRSIFVGNSLLRHQVADLQWK